MSTGIVVAADGVLLRVCCLFFLLIIELFAAVTILLSLYSLSIFLKITPLAPKPLGIQLTKWKAP